MRFSLGLTFNEKKKWFAKWQPWFAWHPVHIGERDWRWLEVVYRRTDHFHGTSGSTWHYSVIEEGPKNEI